MKFDFHFDRMPLVSQIKNKVTRKRYRSISKAGIEEYDRMVSYLNIGFMRAVITCDEHERILKRIAEKLNILLKEEEKNGNGN
jgi:hypothetical protein